MTAPAEDLPTEVTPPEKSGAPVPSEDLRPVVRDRPLAMGVREALEADLRVLHDPPAVLVAAARRIASELDGEPSAQDVVRLSAELRQVLAQIHKQARPATTDLDAVLARVTATEFR